MTTNVDKIVGDFIEKFRPLVKEAVQKADADARGELLAQFNKAIEDAPTASAKPTAASSATVTKRKPGRPKKEASAEAGADQVDGKPKKKRVLSDDVRKKLAENLRKAREAKADKAKPAKKKAPKAKKNASSDASSDVSVSDQAS